MRSIPAAELRELLAEYAQHVRPTRGRGRLVFINLQKRLLSSVEAFYRTLRIVSATDAAREGVKLQDHCADLIHFDIRGTPRGSSNCGLATAERLGQVLGAVKSKGERSRSCLVDRGRAFSSMMRCPSSPCFR